jgi:putative transposase
MLHQKLKRQKWSVNVKRVRRLCIKHGLTLRRRIRRKRRGIGVGLPCRAEYPGHVWAYDFVHDSCENGQKLKILTIEDEFTRRCLVIEVEARIGAAKVQEILQGLFDRHGAPAYIRSDNGGEFIAKSLMSMLSRNNVACRHIDPGSPWQNGLNERFNGTLRSECLNSETFHNREHARAVIQLYGSSYNQDRPHSSLGYQTPSEFAAGWKKKDGCAGGEDGMRLSLCPPPAGWENKDGSIARNDDRPASRKAIHVGAPVARQQSRILRVDRTTVSEQKRAGKVPVRGQCK